MAQAFTRDPDDDTRIIGFLEDVERSLVIELMYQTSVLLSDGGDDAGESDDTGAPSDGDTHDDLFAALSRSMAEREAPQDPALRRLLPDGVKNDDAAASEFRRLTESTLRDGKLRNLDIAMRALEEGFVDEEQAAAIADDVYERANDPAARDERDDAGKREGSDDNLQDGLSDGSREVVLDEASARAMMMALTDVRLVLAERLGLRTDEDAEALSRQVEREDAPNSPEDLLAAYYDFLTWMSESLTLAVMRRA